MAMHDRMGRYLKMVGIWHVVILVAILMGPLAFRIFRPKPPVTIPMEFTVEVPPEAEEAPEEIQQKQPDPVEEEETPEPEDIPEEVEKPKVEKPKVEKPKVEKPKVEKPKVEKPKVEKPKVEKPKVETSKTKITIKTPAKPVTTKGKQLTAAEIRDLLMRGAKPGTTTQIPEDREVLDYSMIRQVLYDAWIQPTREEAGGRDVGVEIRLRRDGTITSCRLTRPSGIAALDDSVLRAVQAVPRIPGLSAGFLAKHDVVTVAFKVEGSGG